MVEILQRTFSDAFPLMKFFVFWLKFDWILFPRVQLTVSQHSFNSLRPVMHICVGNLTIIGSDNGLSPGQRQAIIWTNAGILLIGPLGTNFSEILIEIQTFSFKKIHLKMSSGKWRPFCLDLNVLGNGMAPNKWQSITWNNVNWDLWCHLVSLGLSVLKWIPKYISWG